eukprot:TRINITY_DN27645_c0_g1_i1.p1 TRINITY_DN27645_c0_g1~~TRINITY_DN27645_c0_g1_i1.p1  ORF type:complete len:744 (+),score=310.36 TRINITY_DN27645_c0_g1_i1:134-2365(+)
MEKDKEKDKGDGKMELSLKTEEKIANLARRNFGPGKRKRPAAPAAAKRKDGEGKVGVLDEMVAGAQAPTTPTAASAGGHDGDAASPLQPEAKRQRTGATPGAEREKEKDKEEPRDASPQPTRSGSTAPVEGAAAAADPSKEKDARERSKRRQSKGNPRDNFSVGPSAPKATLQDVGGVEKVLGQLNELVGFPLAHPELFQLLGTEPVSGVLLHGPPGTGKTQLCHAVAHALQVPFFACNGPEIVSGVSGDSEARLRSLFTEAAASAPSLILLDEVDAIAGRREDAGKAMEARIVAQLQTCMDDLAALWRREGKAVLVLGATNRPEVIEPALRRSGRFDREISLGIPTLEDRESILRILTRKLKMAPEVSLREISFLTPGFVGADLHAVVKESAMICMQEIRKHILAHQADPSPQEGGLVRHVPVPASLDIDALAMVTAQHFETAVTRVQPSSMREGFSTIPDVRWEDVGALEDVRREMDLWIEKPIRNPTLYKSVGLGQPAGLLLYGPPGCGKTLVAKAIAHEASANFISVKGPELLNKYVGESERAVRMVFGRARASSPCVLFFDELDALAPKRGMDRTTPGAERLVNQLLTEMDGVEGRQGVYVIAATNRVDMIDPAMIRPGRFDKELYVPLPSPQQRLSVLQALTRKTPLHASVDLRQVSVDARCTGYSGADLKGLVREAAMSAVRRVFDSADPTATTAEVDGEDFENALAICKASVSEKDRRHYEAMYARRQQEREAKP